MEINELIVINGKEYKKMTKELLRLADLAGQIPDRDTLVGIKPNLVGPVLASEGGTTHPEVIEGLIEYLQERGFHNLVLLEGSWVGDVTQTAVEYCGYDRILEKYQIPFWDMQKEPGEERDCAGMRLNICRRIREVGFLINVPVLKGHCQTRITCALKNMKGLLPNSEKRRFHRLGLHRPIAHLSLGIQQDFVLVDSICGDLTFEDGGNPVEQNRLFAGRDPVLVDAFGCFLLGLSVEEVPYLTEAAALGAGSLDIGQARITAYLEKTEDGRSCYEPTEPSRIQRVQGGYGYVMKLAEKAEEVDSCSACYGYLLPALEMLEREGLLDSLTEKVCIGQGHRGKKGELGVGNCTRGFQHSLEGCPPTENQMYEFLKDYIRKNSF